MKLYTLSRFYLKILTIKYQFFVCKKTAGLLLKFTLILLIIIYLYPC